MSLGFGGRKAGLMLCRPRRKPRRRGPRGRRFGRKGLADRDARQLLVVEEPLQLLSPSLRKAQEGSGKGSMTISHITRGEKGRMLTPLHP